ncbi:MAG: permease, partial [candidate division WOR-3 bacterium]
MFLEIIKSGFLALKDYAATHILTCLVPAFLLAGAIVTFINRNAILEHLGEETRKSRSFPLASISSFFLAACSCTVIPVASGLYYGGAGIGVAFIVLWVAPAANILALTYTGNILGGGMVISRIVAALFMAFIVGWVMSFVFRGERKESITTTEETQKKTIIERKGLVLLLLILLSLLLPNYLVRGGAYIYKVLVWLISSLVMLIYAIKVFSKEK